MSFLPPSVQASDKNVSLLVEDWLITLMFYFPLDKKQAILEMIFPANLSASTK